MKKIIPLLSIFIFSLISCEESFTPRMTIDVESEKSSYGKNISISPMDDSVIISKHKISIAPHEENQTYTISGYFDGQILVNTKNTIIKLDRAYLENSSGKAALQSSAKIEVSSAKDSCNYIISSTRRFARSAALQSKRGLVLGGSGILKIKGAACHGIEADDVKIKGSGTLYVEGRKYGSALNCESLEVNEEKTFTAYFLNSKNGIKADKTVAISSGNFYFYDNNTAIKTDTKSESPKEAHSITLYGGNFYHDGKGEFTFTDENAFNVKGAQIFEE
ncbi:MAG: carbohydrate-binding domain-containing protein [Treponema sp.]|nr:carbohydrate-binding domain-containing protein [Treponema sp.]